jgi:hypothetical protein
MGKTRGDPVSPHFERAPAPHTEFHSDNSGEFANQFTVEQKTTPLSGEKAELRRVLRASQSGSGATPCQQVKGKAPSQSRGKPETGGCHGKKRVLRQSEICQERRTMKTVQRKNEHRISAGTVKRRSKR